MKMVKDKSEEQTDQEKFSSGTLQASMEALKEVFISWQLEKNGVEYQFDESASMIDVVDAVAQALVNDVA
jgi:hypothetical protein